MDTATLSKADRFFPLIANSPENSGGSISLQNILDLRDNGMLDALRGLQREIVRIRSQSQFFDDALTQDPQLTAFFKFVDAALEVSQAKRVMDSGQFVTVTRQDGTNISLDPENFHLNCLKDCLQHIQERYGRFDWADREDSQEAPRKSGERIIAMTKWLLMKNHAIDYLMTFEVTRVAGSGDFIVRPPKWDGTRPISENERKTLLAEMEGFLIACCHPGRLGVFPAANVQVNYGYP
jgi:hypothetical protein